MNLEITDCPEINKILTQEIVVKRGRGRPRKTPIIRPKRKYHRYERVEGEKFKPWETYDAEIRQRKVFYNCVYCGRLTNDHNKSRHQNTTICKKMYNQKMSSKNELKIED